MWVETQPSAQSSFQKLNVDNSCQKTCKIIYYIFEVLSNFTVFLYFLPNILSRILVKEQSYLSTLKITLYQITLFFCKRHTPPLRMKSNGVTVLKGKYFTLMIQQIFAVSQLLFLVQIL